MEDQTAAPEAEPRALLRPATRRWAVGLLAAGALSVGFILLPHLPRDRQVDLRIDDPITVTGVDITWSRPSGADREAEPVEEPLRGASFRFPPGTAPQKIKYFIRLPDGSYRVDVVVQRGEQSEPSRRTVTLDDAEQITLPLR